MSHTRRPTHIFKTKQSRVVIAQFPNPPLILALIFYFLTRLSTGPIHQLSFWNFHLSLLYWSYLEITSGVNLWRRTFGTAVGLYLILSLFN